MAGHLELRLLEYGTQKVEIPWKVKFEHLFQKCPRYCQGINAVSMCNVYI